MSPGTLTYRYWCKFRRKAVEQSPIFGAFLVAFFFGLALLISSVFLKRPCFSMADKVALFVGLFGGGVVYWQGSLIKRQIEVGTMVDLYKEWNSEEMQKKRQAAWKGEDPNPDTVEDVLEFLEKVSTLEKTRFITRQLIWDTFGWYIGRYYFYSKKTISETLRLKWTPRGDPTLYQDLERFYSILVRLEVEQRNEKSRPGDEPVSATQIEQEYQQTRKKFIESETGEKLSD